MYIYYVLCSARTRLKQSGKKFVPSYNNNIICANESINAARLYTECTREETRRDEPCCTTKNYYIIMHLAIVSRKYYYIALAGLSNYFLFFFIRFVKPVLSFANM